MTVRLREFLARENYYELLLTGSCEDISPAYVEREARKFRLTDDPMFEKLRKK